MWKYLNLSSACLVHTLLLNLLMSSASLHWSVQSCRDNADFFSAIAGLSIETGWQIWQVFFERGFLLRCTMIDNSSENQANRFRWKICSCCWPGFLLGKPLLLLIWLFTCIWKSPSHRNGCAVHSKYMAWSLCDIRLSSWSNNSVKERM